MKKYRGYFILLLLLFAPVSRGFGGYTLLHQVTLSGRVEVSGGGIPPPVGQVFSHTPMAKVNIVGDQIVLAVTLSSQSTYSNCTLYYRIKGVSSYTPKMFLPRITTNLSSYRGEAVIPSGEVTTAGVEYYITAKGPTNAWNYMTGGTPQDVPFVSKESLVVAGENRSITLADGNPYDGQAGLTLGEYPENGTVSFQQKVNTGDLPKNAIPHILSETPVMVYLVEPISSVLTGSAGLNLLYLDVNQDGKEDTQGADETLLKVFWYDGHDWRYVGGTVDAEKNTILAGIYRFGIFAVFPIAQVDESVYKPVEKIITPNNDGVNDSLLFSGLTGGFEIKIVDVSGRLVRSITDAPFWDGKDSSGRDAPGGVYFYMLKKNGKTMKGTFVIAR